MNKTLTAIAIGSLLFLSACSSNQDTPKQEALNTQNTDGQPKLELDKKTDMEKLANVLQENRDTPKDLIPNETFKAQLPATLADLPRTKLNGKTMAVANVKLSLATGVYSKGNTSIEVSLNDMAGLGGALASAVALLNEPLDEQTANGYKKTAKHEGFNSLEEYNSKTKSGQITTLVGTRILVKIAGKNVSQRQLLDAIQGLNLKKMATIE